MPFTIPMPKLSPTMEEGTIAKWHKAVDDMVEAGDLLFEVTTDKATVEYNAIDSGFLRKILVPEGQNASVNQPVALLTETKDESIEGFKLPKVDKPQPVKKAEETPIEANQTSVKASSQGAATRQPAFIPAAPLTNYAFQHATEPSSGRVKASPLAKKIAKEKGLDLTTLKGTGPGHRIVSKDLERAQHAGIVTFSRRETPEHIPGSFEEEIPTPMRKVIGQRLQESKSYIPHFYAQQSIDADALVAIREQCHNLGLKLSVNDFVVRACALALKEHPTVNSGFNSVNQTIIRFKTIDISVAVSVDGGLITPIVRHADYKNLGELSLEIKGLVAKAKAGKLDPQEYIGGSFTVSNLGMYGTTDFQAIINPPQAAIIAVGAIQDVPVVKNGHVVPGKVMNITLSADHRVVDGVAGAEFLRTLRHLLENPAGLLI